MTLKCIKYIYGSTASDWFKQIKSICWYGDTSPKPPSQSPSSFSRKSVSVFVSTATIKYSTPSPPWRIMGINVKWETPEKAESCDTEWELGIIETALYLACPYQFVVSELSQLSPQSEVRVNQECLSTTLVEILEWQPCTQWKENIKIMKFTWKSVQRFKVLSMCVPVYEGLSLFSSWNFTSSLKIPLQKEPKVIKNSISSWVTALTVH